MDKQTRFHVCNSGKFCNGIYFLSLCIHLNEVQQQGQATWIAKFQSRSLLSNVTKKTRLNRQRAAAGTRQLPPPPPTYRCSSCRTAASPSRQR